MDAFKRYDFDKDEGWKSYIRSVELPGRNLDEAMLRVKARWYKKNIEPNFDLSQVLPSVGAQQQSQGSAASTANKGPSVSTGSGYTPRPPPPPHPPPRYGKSGSGTYGNVAAQRRLFFMHLSMLVLGAVAFMRFLPYSRGAYLNLMRLTTVTVGYKIYLQHGLPSFRPFSMLLEWAQRVMLTADVQQLIIALSFSALPPILLVPVPVLVLALYHVNAYCAAHFISHPLWQRYGSPLRTFLLQKQDDALMLNAYCEVLTAAWMLPLLFTNMRSMLTFLFYLQVLKIKLHVPDSMAQHRRVWRKINEITLSYRVRLLFLERIIQLAVSWFMSVPGAH